MAYAFSRPAWLEPRTAYIHVPFCGHHCGYCDFAVTAGQDHLIELYLDALEIELSRLGQPTPVETRFIGGGTPTYLELPQLERLLAMIDKWLPLVDSDQQKEYSIEATPESVNEAKADLLARFGITRVSLGVQSFHPHLLQALDREHGVHQIEESLAALRRHPLVLSLDLIFSSPGQTLAEWSHDLDRVLALQVPHLSTYGLTYEKGTPLWKQRERGEVRSVPEEQELAMYQLSMGRLTAAGYEHYEVSNFARPGNRCRHNERYWANEAYHGFGVGAARYVEGSRELNVRGTKIYIRQLLDGFTPTYQQEKLEPLDRAVETIAIQLRRADGVERTRFQEQTGFALDPLIGEALQMGCELGFLSDDGRSVKLTRAGFPLADAMVEKILQKAPGTPPARKSRSKSG